MSILSKLKDGKQFTFVEHVRTQFSSIFTPQEEKVAHFVTRAWK